MRVICLTPIEAGVYNDHSAEHITMPKEGEAYIPEPGGPIPLEWQGKDIDYTKPSTFPRLGSITVEELTYTREVEVQKTRYVPMLDDDGNPMLDEQGEPMTQPEPYTDKEPQEYTMLTVTAMTEGTLPEPSEEAAPDAQADTDALLIDHELRLTLLELGLGGEVN